MNMRFHKRLPILASCALLLWALSRALSLRIRTAARSRCVFAAGWTKANLVDPIVVIGDETVTKYL
jgi:hypothetical protein